VIDALIESTIGGGSNGDPNLSTGQQRARLADQAPELNLHTPRP